MQKKSKNHLLKTRRNHRFIDTVLLISAIGGLYDRQEIIQFGYKQLIQPRIMSLSAFQTELEVM